MRALDQLEALAIFDQLLDEVERGETVQILRNGKVIARFAPADKQLAEIKSKKRRAKKPKSGSAKDN